MLLHATRYLRNATLPIRLLVQKTRSVSNVKVDLMHINELMQHGELPYGKSIRSTGRLLYFSKYLVNVKFHLVTNYIFKKSCETRIHGYILRTKILSTFLHK